MLIRKYIRSSKYEKLVIALLMAILVGVTSISYSVKMTDLAETYQKYTQDMTTAIDDMTSKISLLSKLGVFQNLFRLHEKPKAQVLLNKAIFKEDNVSNLYLVDNQNDVFATNTHNSGGILVGEEKEFQKINWEFISNKEIVTNKFGEFGYFLNKSLRVVYLSKVIASGDLKLGSLTAIFKYGDMMDALKIKHGLPPVTTVYLVNNTASLGQDFQCNTINKSLNGFSVCYKLSFLQAVNWAKWSLISNMLLTLLVCGLMFTVFSLINQKLVLPREYFNSIIERLNRDQTDKEGVESIPVPAELMPVLPKLQILMQAIVRSSSVDLARQVAHDIRSPLAALNIVLGTVNSIDEETRLLIRHSITRIQDIANNLLSKSREDKVKNEESTKKLDVHLISSLIEGIVTEKRTQYRERINVEIIHRQCEKSYGIFCDVVPSEFKRFLSNLVNNSVEAITEKGSVTISLESEDGFGKICIKDNGKGLSKECLTQIGQRGFTIKADGSGLGLSHAYKTIESWKGKIDFESELGAGTVVTIRLPLAKSPAWFVDELKLVHGASVVILDDDASIHQIWDQRIQSSGVEIVHLSTPDQLSEWIKANSSKPAVYLIDYELLGFSKSGLDLIVDNNIAEKSILVTSRFEEKVIRERCAELKVRLIPKGLAGFIPITSNTNNLDAVLIDDELLTHEMWKLRAKQFGKSILCFKESSEFFSIALAIQKSTPIYVDLNLGMENGSLVTSQVRAAGFENVFLATGDDASNISLKDISGVIGKNPPWVKETIL